MKCRIAGDELKSVLDLGNQFLSDFVEPGQETSGVQEPLQVGWSPSSGIAQLMHTVAPERMYEKYWYRSGINEQMRKDLGAVADTAKKWTHLTDGDYALDIACNDFTLLKESSPLYPRGTVLVGIDPSDVARDAFMTAVDWLSGEGHEAAFVNQPFSKANYWSVSRSPAKVITCCAMFYDLDNPLAFLEDVWCILHRDGVFILQLSYTPLMIKQNAFDNIGHEHLCYYTFATIKSALEATGFTVVDVEINDVNCGSMRVVCRRNEDHSIVPQHLVDLGEYRVKALAAYEHEYGFESWPTPWIEFAQRVRLLKESTLDWLHESKKRGKRVVGYGASTKGNTLLQTYGITPDLMDCIVEKDPKKFGKVTVGTGIPIVSEAQIRTEKADYMFVLPWTFVNGIRYREQEMLAGGTKLVVPLPELRVLDCA